VLCFPSPGVLASEILGTAQSKLDDLKKNLPPGYQLEIGGEQAKKREIDADERNQKYHR
jgi:hypothetical protein